MIQLPMSDQGEINKSALMAREERRECSDWAIYRDYLSTQASVLAPIVLLLLTLSQVAQGGSVITNHILASF